MCPLSEEQLNKFVEDTKSKMESEIALREWASTRSSLKDGVQRGDGMYFEFVLCLLIYTAHSLYCTTFRSSFRKLKYNDTENTIRQRHVDNFYWFGRFLQCALRFYGQRATAKQTFYHGLDHKFLFDSFSAVFEIPVSTTDSESTAMQFAEGGRGVVIHFSPKFNHSNVDVHYLAVNEAGLSPFKNERELLLAGETVLAMTDLITFKPKKRKHSGFMKCFLYWERIMEQTIETRMSYNNGMITKKNKKQWMERQRKYLMPLIQRRMMVMERKEDDDDDDDIPIYIEQLFNQFCDRKSSLNLSCLLMEKQFMDQSLREILFKVSDDVMSEVLDVEAVVTIFPNVQSLINIDGKSLNISKM